MKQSEKGTAKTCGYCGRENEDTSKYCFECGTSFSIEGDASSAAKGIHKVATVLRWMLWLVAWGAVVVVTLRDNPEYLRSFFAFPIGFCGLLSEKASIYAVMLGQWFLIPGGWALYAWLSLIIKRTQRVASFLIFYMVFCVLLALNVGGCEKLIHTAAEIQ